MELDKLALQLQAAKQREDEAKAERINIETKLIELLGCKDEGSQTHKGEQFKVTITGKINRTLDAAAWDAIKEHIPANLHPVKYKPEIDIRGLKWLMEHDQAVYATACQAISAKPGKPAVTFEEIK